MAHILLVDDNEITLAIEKLMLESCGLSVDTALSGLEAVRLAQQNQYFLILMDIHMPEMNGFQAAELIREVDSVTPVIALSADVIPPDDPDFLRCEMNGSLVKPLQKSDLANLLHQFSYTSPTMEQSDGSGDAVFDEDALFAVMKEPSAVQRVLSQFLSVHKDDCEHLRSLVKSGNFTSAREILHNIIGISGNLFCEKLHRISRSLSDELKQSRADCLDEFTELWNTTFKTLSDCSGKLSDKSETETFVVDWKSLWENFILLCNEFDITAADVFSEHIGIFKANMEPGGFEQLKNAVFSYDFLWIIDNMEDCYVQGTFS